MQKQCSHQQRFREKHYHCYSPKPMGLHAHHWGLLVLKMIRNGRHSHSLQPHTWVFTQSSQTQSLHWVYSHHAWLCNILHSHTEKRPRDLLLLKKHELRSRQACVKTPGFCFVLVFWRNGSISASQRHLQNNRAGI